MCRRRSACASHRKYDNPLRRREYSARYKVGAQGVSSWVNLSIYAYTRDIYSMNNEIHELLARRGVLTSRELQDALGVGQATVSRHLQALGEAVVRIGAGPATRYALATEERSLSRPIPIYRIREDSASGSALRTRNASTRTCGRSPTRRGAPSPRSHRTWRACPAPGA